MADGSMDTEPRAHAQASAERRSSGHRLESPPALLGLRLRWSVLRRHRRTAKAYLAEWWGRGGWDRRLGGGGTLAEMPLLSGWGPAAEDGRAESDRRASGDVIALGEDLH
jgi:hypothetical protein